MSPTIPWPCKSLTTSASTTTTISKWTKQMGSLRTRNRKRKLTKWTFSSIYLGKCSKVSCNSWFSKLYLRKGRDTLSRRGKSWPLRLCSTTGLRTILRCFTKIIGSCTSYLWLLKKKETLNLAHRLGAKKALKNLANGIIPCSCKMRSRASWRNVASK